jgi:hypothetical protein
MASRALSRVEEPYQTWQRIGTAPNRIAEASECDPPAFSYEADGLYVSSRAARGGAKAAMMAIGMEAAAAICFTGVWLLWRILR